MLIKAVLEKCNCIEKKMGKKTAEEKKNDVGKRQKNTFKVKYKQTKKEEEDAFCGAPMRPQLVPTNPLRTAKDIILPNSMYIEIFPYTYIRTSG